MLGREELTAPVRRLLGSPTVEVVDWRERPARSSTGKATARVEHVTGTARALDDGQLQPWRLVVKTLRASEGDAERPDHWTYWKREALAYQSGVLPDGHRGLSAARCLGVFADDGSVTIALAELPADRVPHWALEHYVTAARDLGSWQRSWLGREPQLAWLAADQLAQRIARTDASGGLVLPPCGLADRLRRAWDRRWRTLADLAAVPLTLCHGDFSRGNLSFGPDGQLFVIDWATLGLSPPGFDLAHLVLSAMVELGLTVPPATIADVLVEAYGAAPAFVGSALLTGISRLCWTMHRTRDPSVVRCWERIAGWLGTLAP